MYLRPIAAASNAVLESELRRLEVDESCLGIFLDKKDSFLLKIKGMLTPAANILKQTALSLGADVAVHRDVITGKVDCSDALFMGTRRQLGRVAVSLSGQPFGLAGFEKQIFTLLGNLENPPSSINLPKSALPLDRPVIMGVLNVTPDSFSDGGSYLEPSAAISRLEEMLNEGADIIDVGAESSRPGADAVSTDTQIERLNPVFEYLKTKDIHWSIDTTSPLVAERAIKAGASIINDVSGGKVPELWSLASRSGAAYVLMHSKGVPKTMQNDPQYDDFNEELYEFFRAKLDEINAIGLSVKKMLIDPGIGFGKRVHDNSLAIARLAELKAFGVPILVGASRKSFIGKLLGLEVGERLEASIAASVISYLNGASILRVHDVAEHRRALDAASLISKGGER
ncbi:dihydropteroate synthase [bacterium]|nr:dihydropteroate synthase [bacterium]